MVILAACPPQSRARMPRIALGGFQHETNTFAPSKARFEDFEPAGR